MNGVGLLVVVLVSALAKHTPGAREGRWFRGAYTETKIRQEIVTSLIPSSCVLVSPTLPPCKSVRSLGVFPEFGRQQIYPNYLNNRQIIESRNLNENSGSQKIVLGPIIEEQPSEVGWAEYLGLAAPTVTITEVDLKTVTVFDPRTVVTFSVRGCQPSKSPLDLNACDVPKQNLNDISPTKILDTVVTPTIFDNNKDDANLDYNQLRNIEVESSASSIPSKDIYYVPTEELTNARFRKY